MSLDTHMDMDMDICIYIYIYCGTCPTMVGIQMLLFTTMNPKHTEPLWLGSMDKNDPMDMDTGKTTPGSRQN